MVDVLIVGAGPAGMAAAVRASSGGMRVTVVDDNPGSGGQIWRGANSRISWFDRLKRSGAEVITGARAVAGNAFRRSMLVERHDQAITLTYRKLILATGAREFFLPFPGWTSPRVVGIGGLQALAKSGLSVEGKRIIVAGSGPFLLAAAALFRKQGAIVALLAEQAPGRQLAKFGFQLFRMPGKLAQAMDLKLQLGTTRYLPSCWVEAMNGNTAKLRRRERVWEEPCDYLATGYGFRPNVELAAALGCDLDGVSVTADEWQKTTLPDVYAAGECTGIGGVDLALIEGQIAGLAASGQVEEAKKLLRERFRARQFAQTLGETFGLRPELRDLPKADTIVCRCEDVRWQAVRNSRSRREAKLYTRCGMGACQGRICGPILDFLQHPDRDTARTPVFPARLETLLTDQESTQR